MTFRAFLAAITPTTTEALHTVFAVSVIAGVFLALCLVVYVLTKIEDRIQRALRDDEPFVDDVAERRRMRAEVFAARRRQLDAAAVGRRR